VKVSVIVAAHNEGPQISSALKRLRQISKTSPIELIVVDGGSDDGTVAAARDWADHMISYPRPNRGAQWHAGAQVATGDLLLFLRADSQPPSNWQQALEHFWLTTHDMDVVAVGFRVSYGSGLGLRLLSAWSNARVRSGVIGADHGICTTPDVYKAAGGFPEFPELEDYEFSRRLAARGTTRLLPAVIHSAARRLRSQGPLLYAARRLWLEGRYRRGVPTAELFRVSGEI
jgi:glycosyltransferase involved in cell wall biosynthesis